MTERYVDPAHRVPDDQWAEVVRLAQEIYDAHDDNKTGGAASPAGPLVNMLGSGKHSGVTGIPTQLLVLHSGECPLRGGYAQSLTNWGNIPIASGGPIASWHWFIDPIARVRMIEEKYAAWHASEANPMSEGFEQAGYARYSRAEWTTPDGMLQMESLAYTMAERAIANGIPPVWLTTDQVTAVTTHGNRSIKGFCLHRQIDPETRTDPGDGYPYDLLMQKIRGYMGLGTITTQGTTTSEEDELAFTISELLNHPAYDGGPTVSQVLKNLDDNEVTRYLKGDKSDTLYDVTDDGKLRPIILAEWQATGRPYRTLPQVIINALPKTS